MYGPAPDLAPVRNPAPAYQATPGSILHPNRSFYSTLAATANTPSRTCIDSITIPIRSGRAFVVPKGHICRLSTPQGPQVGDLNIWNLHNPRERFWASRTRQLHAAHVSVFDRLWSCLPYLRPMVTIIGDSLQGYEDEVGGRCHDLLGTRCDPYVNKMLSGTNFDFHCHSNLVRAVLPYGLTEFDVHDVLNVFQVTGLNQDDKYYMEPCPAKSGDYFEFFAEQDLLCALSTCPGGDLSAWGFGTNDNDMEACCRPLRAEVFQLDEKALVGWEEPTYKRYDGGHGVAMPVWGENED